jgi:type VI secretion system protein VasJ
VLEALKFISKGRSNTKWAWSAWGKHPLAKDYIQLGDPTPMGKAFAQWIAKGHKRLASQPGDLKTPVAWRFWARGEGRNQLVCGTIQTSSDGIGRPFPLLLMGNGVIKGWRKQWTLLPPALESTWRRMEHLGSYQGKSIHSFEEALTAWSSPRPHWDEIRVNHTPEDFSLQTPAPLNASDRENLLADYARRQMFSARLETGGGSNLMIQTVRFHHLIHHKSVEIPAVVFMGGIPTAAYVTFFQRSLKPADFIRLWRTDLVDQP